MDICELRNSGEGGRHPWELARLDFVCSLIKSEQKALPDNPVVLDIGCGDGFVSASLAQRFPGARMICVDTALDPPLIKTLEEKWDRNDIRFVNSLDIVEEDRVDVVLMLDVLEHIEDPKGFLISLKKRVNFSQNVRFIVTTPAFNLLFSGHDRILGHHRRYNVGELKEILTGAGLEPFDSGYFFSSLLVARILGKMSEALGLSGGSKQSALSVWSGSSALTWLIHRTLNLDVFITQKLKRLGFTLPGLSSYTVCGLKQH